MPAWVRLPLRVERRENWGALKTTRSESQTSSIGGPELSMPNCCNIPTN